MRMKVRDNYKKYVIEVITFALRDGGFTAHYSIEKHDGKGVWDTYLTSGKIYQTEELAKEEGLKLAKQAIDTGFHRLPTPH